jgi:hypothetical protein
MNTLDDILQYAAFSNLALPYSKSLAKLCITCCNSKLLDEILYVVQQSHPDNKEDYGMTLSRVQCGSSTLDVIKVLEKYLGAYPLSRVRENILLAHASSPGCDIEVFTYCCQSPTPQIIDKALFVAVMNVNVKIVKLLLARPTVTINNDILCRACIDLDMFKLILSAAKTYDLLIVKRYAINYAHLDVIKYLHSLGVSFTAQDFSNLDFRSLSMVNVQGFVKFMSDNGIANQEYKFAINSLYCGNIDVFHYFITEHNVDFKFKDYQKVYPTLLSNLACIRLFNYGYVPDSKKFVRYVCSMQCGYGSVEYLNSVGAISHKSELILDAMIAGDMRMVNILTKPSLTAT